MEEDAKDKVGYALLERLVATVEKVGSALERKLLSEAELAEGRAKGFARALELVEVLAPMGVAAIVDKVGKKDPAS